MKKKVFMLMLSMTLVLGTFSTSAFAAENELSGEIKTVSTVQESSKEAVEEVEDTEPAGDEIPAEAQESVSDTEEDAKTETDQIPMDEEISAQTNEIASGTCGENLTWVLTEDGTLTVSGEGEMETEAGENVPWYQYASSIQKVVIENGVTSIGARAFGDCSVLKEIVIPSSVTSIEDAAFISCISLSAITIPNSVTRIGGSVFNNCRELISITIPDSVTNIGDSVFADCVKLEEVLLPNTITDISGGMFWRCTSLKKIVIPDSVTSIGADAFWHCFALETVEIPNGVTQIGSFAFQLCTSLKEITFSESLTSIGEEAFANCSGLESVVIPESVNNVDLAAFLGCTGLKEVTILNRVINIGQNVFADCGDVIIYGYEGSTVETYARDNDLNFVALTESKLEIVPEKTDEVYVKGSGTDAVIYCTGEYADFVSVEMDGTLVDPGNYKVEDGSTVLTFTSSYLDTLSVGRHTVTLNYIDESISTYLAIVETESQDVTPSGDGNITGSGTGGSGVNRAVKTGDQTNVAFALMLSMASVMACITVWGMRKRAMVRK